jgi:serine/threonine protein kinase
MDLSVENLCGLLMRSKLLPPEEVKALYQRWLAEAGDQAASPAHFSKWLVARQVLTEHQAGLLARGHADNFFLNQYKVLDRLGRGRMAGVYKAVHQLGQVVAIKVLPPSRAKDPQTLARFQREARLALRLKHPNVVRAFQVGEANGLHYLVMEYLEGETLEDALQRRRRLPPHEAARAVHQALSGLQHIHEQGLVHRDLKPGNLMLVPARQPGEPDTTVTATLKVLDIGLGRQLFEESGQAAAADLELTGQGVLIGTPDYMAPEQARDPRAIDIRADIYSLGCVLYHCLTGQPPFPDANILNKMVRHATEMPRPIRELNPAVPDGLQQIINWMLAKDPARRYPTPERAGQALQVFLVADSEPPRTSEDGPQMRKYLTWLETAPGAEAKEAEPAPPRAVAAPVAPLAQPVCPPARKTAEPAPAHHEAARKQRRHKKRTGARPGHVAATREPAGAPPVALPAAPAQFDVELVPLNPAAVPSAAPQAPGPGLSRRDWMLLGIGAAAVIVAMSIGMVLAFALR